MPVDLDSLHFLSALLSPRYITIAKFSELTGYTVDAVQSKIKRGQWLMDQLWVKAPDGRILIDLQGYAAWAEGKSQHAERP